MTEEKQKQLGKTLWAIADQLRGAMDAAGFRDYISKPIEHKTFSGIVERTLKERYGDR